MAKWQFNYWNTQMEMLDMIYDNDIWHQLVKDYYYPYVVIHDDALSFRDFTMAVEVELLIYNVSSKLGLKKPLKRRTSHRSSHYNWYIEETRSDAQRIKCWYQPSDRYGIPTNTLTHLYNAPPFLSGVVDAAFVRKSVLRLGINHQRLY